MKTTLRLGIAAFGLVVFNLSAATLYVSLESTNPVAPYATWATAATNIQHAVDVSKAGDTVLVTNGVYSVGSRDVVSLAEAGEEWGTNSTRVVVTNAIRLESVNGPLLTVIEGSQVLDEYGNPMDGIRCVLLGTNVVLSGFTLANGFAAAGGGVWCASTNSVLTNCVMATNRAGIGGGGGFGGTLYNCKLIGNSATIDGGGAFYSTLHDCVLTGNSAVEFLGRIRPIGLDWPAGGGASRCILYNCTLSGNSANDVTYSPGGGAYRCTLYNCTLSGNRATQGGGAQNSTLYNCTLSGNSASSGGGAYGGTLYNCTLVNNSAEGGGGACSDGSLTCMLYNCIVYNNAAQGGANYSSAFTTEGEEATTHLNYCCTTPLPTNGVGNIVGPPLFMDTAAGDFRLREGSPCIDAGTNLVGMAIVPFYIPDTGETTLLPYTYKPTDILGNTRFIDGNFDGKVAWDIGAYEFNSFKPPQFTVGPQLTADGWKLNIIGAPNKWVRVQRSSNLKDWEDLWSGWMAADETKQVMDGDVGQKVMFYRVVVP